MGVKQILKKVVPEKIKFYIRLQLSRIRYRSLIKTTQKHYEELIENLRNCENQPLRFAAYVVFDSTFGADNLIKLIQNDSSISFKIVVIPDTSRGKIHMLNQYNSTKEFFINKYGNENVVDGYDINNESFNDVSDYFDIIYFANPYDSMVHNFHGIEYNASKNILSIYIPYAFQPDKYCRSIISQKNMALCWKIFSDTEYSIKEYKKYSLNYGKNVILSGYSKMDKLEESYFLTSSNKRKQIIIAPHHTITNKDLPLSNFLRLKDYILNLPQKFPGVDFIFRPHPLLFTNMINEGFWTLDDKENYIQKLKEKGIKCSFGGDYFSLFARSDAMIHDCSSYIVEYLFVDKPCCFVIRSNMKKILCKLGIECLKCYNIARTEDDIDKFISSVCSSTANKFENRRKKVLPKIKYNYPNSSKIIFEEIKKLIY